MTICMSLLATHDKGRVLEGKKERDNRSLGN